MLKIKELTSKIHDYNFLATYKVERNASIKVKLLALLNFQEGKTVEEVACIVRYSDKSVKSWLERFAAYDYEGLICREGRGRKPRLPPDAEESFKLELDKLQESKDGGRITAWEIRDLLANKFDSCYSLSGVYALLDRLNIVWISGRSKHPKCSQEAIEQFKANFPEATEKIKEKLDSEKIEIFWVFC